MLAQLSFREANLTDKELGDNANWLIPEAKRQLLYVDQEYNLL
jgi:hypothetical protein